MKLYQIILPSFIFIFSCSAATNKEPKAKAKMQEENPSLAASDTTVKLGDVFTINLSIAAGQGFSWKIADSIYKQHLLFINETFTNTSTQKDGADGVQHFNFKAVQKGQGIIHFMYVQPFIKPYPKDAKTKSFTISIL